MRSRTFLQRSRIWKLPTKRNHRRRNEPHEHLYVRKGNPGLANYIMKNGGQAKGRAIAYDSRRLFPGFADRLHCALLPTGYKAIILNPLRPDPELLRRSHAWMHTELTLRPALQSRSIMIQGLLEDGARLPLLMTKN